MIVEFNKNLNNEPFNFKNNITLKQKKVFLVAFFVISLFTIGFFIIRNYLKTKKITVLGKINHSPNVQKTSQLPKAFDQASFPKKEDNSNRKDNLSTLPSSPKENDGDGSEVVKSASPNKKPLTQPASPKKNIDIGTDFVKPTSPKKSLTQTLSPKKTLKGRKNLILNDLNDLQLKEIFLKNPTLETVDFWNSMQVTDLGVCFLNLLPCLKSLNLVGFNVSHKSLASIPPGLSHLKLMHFHDLDDGDLSSLPPNLLSLHLHDCPINGEGFKNLPRGLLKLNVTFCRNICWDDFIESLPPQLLEVDLSDCSINDKNICQLPKSLKYLNLSGCCITNKAIKDLPRDLEALNLCDCDVTDAEIADLPQGLKKLYISGRGITDIGISHLPPNLESLTLSNCLITDDAIPLLPKGLRALAFLSCPKITDAGVSLLPKEIENLHFHKLSFGNAGLANLHHLKKLLFFKLDGSGTITQSGLAHLPRSIIGLDLSLCLLDIDPSDLSPGLTSLNLAHSSLLTDKKIGLLSRKLKHLNVSGCRNLTDAMIPDLPKGLKSLNVSKCSLSEVAISQLRKTIPIVITSGELPIKYVPPVY